MLKDVEFSRYRGFKTFAVKGLSRVNLFVGLNNSGKTALLEGIQFFVSRGEPSVLAQAASRRGEVAIRGADDYFVDVAHFFYGHEIAPDTSFQIKGSGYPSVTLKINAGRQGMRPRALTIEVHNDKNHRVFPIFRDGLVQLQEQSPWPAGLLEQIQFERSSRPESLYIGTDQVDSVLLAAMMDEVAILGRDNMLADAMRLLDPLLESVRMLSGASPLGFRKRGGVIVKRQDSERPVPLGSMGEGMRRMLTLASALAAAREGQVFIDEIDTGLHYSIMHKMWELIITTASSYDIQVFASTHSYDCIYGLAKFLRAQPDVRPYVALHRIDSGKDESVPFDAEEVLAAIRNDIEIR